MNAAASSVSQDTSPARVCVVVPAYNEGPQIGRTIAAIRSRCDCVIVVDDGSTDGTVAEAEEAGATVIRHPENRGKGAALNTGYAHAVKAGYDMIITMDADGQHAADDIPGFLAAVREQGVSVVVGSRMADPASMPFVRRMTNRFMSWLLSRHMGQRVPDTQCGFRLYTREVIPLIKSESNRFDAESEVLLNLADHGVRIGSAPVRIIYGDEVSKINPVRDTVRFFRMLRKHRRAKQGR